MRISVAAEEKPRIIGCEREEGEWRERGESGGNLCLLAWVAQSNTTTPATAAGVKS